MVIPPQPSDCMILVIGQHLEGHSVIFLAIQTHLSCRSTIRTISERTNHFQHSTRTVKSRAYSGTLRLRVYEFIATPAHAWLWLCGRVLGMRFECGPVADDEAALD